MPVQTSYPGVYVQEISSGVHPITGVSTSIAVFIGRAKKGPLNFPIQCLNLTDFNKIFSSDFAGGDLARSVKLFFLNGGTKCYVTRIANGAKASSITLQNEAKVDVLTFTAKSPGTIGDTIRLNVTYNGLQPESTFNIEIFRWETNNSGQPVKVESEIWQNLSMNPQDPKYTPLYINQNSSLVSVTDKFNPAPPAAPLVLSGFSQSGRSLPKTVADYKLALQSALNQGTQFRISVNGASFINVDLSSLNLAVLATTALIVAQVQTIINSALPASTPVTVTNESGPGTTFYIRITSASGDVFIQPAQTNDLAKALMLGTAQGGYEKSGFAVGRPAPNGAIILLDNPATFAALAQTAFDTITIDGINTSLTGINSLKTSSVVGALMYQDGVNPVPSITGNSDGVREKLAIIANAINNNPANTSWIAQVWGLRLALVSKDKADNYQSVISTGGAGGTNIGGNFKINTRYYSLGTTGSSPFQDALLNVQGNDGSAPLLSDYNNVFPILDKEIDLFNLLILPRDSQHTVSTTTSLWGPASVFCQLRRAFLLMDSLDSWSSVQAATNPSTGVNSLRIGLVKDHSAIFYPRVTINENGINVQIAPSGAVAGLMARIDSNRGVWKAPAGTEADIRGIVGLEYKFTDAENGVLNPHAINTLRIFPDGIVNWGARTMDGDDDFGSEYKYIPVRRTALFIEESLYRGLKWVVFEPNDEPLWASIRLNVGAFMHGLFRQGAFQGKTKQDAYFVKCDSETTTQNDINLGIVNIWVGFAPLKPAEFVILTLQQMAGQIQV
jgi:hypothetical protein